MTFRRWQISGVICALIIITCSLVGGACSQTALSAFSETRSLMDTFITVTVYAPDKDSAEAAFDAAFERMSQIEQAASIYLEAAEAYQLNARGFIEGASDDLKNLVEQSVEYGELTGGYFDITVQPVLELWESGLWKETLQVQQERVSEAMELVGYDKIVLNGDSISLQPEMKITLGGVAKGYAAGEALRALEEIGIEHAVVNAGGDSATLGKKPDGSGWLASLKNPDDSTQWIAAFSLEGDSIATSGNYERYFSPDKQVSHLLNPLTGFSESNCISVTIITPRAELADALATAVFVMGPAEGISFVNSLDDVECMIIDNDRQIHRSSGLNKYEVQGANA
ncbi:MAG: FAD:protein FMN transferase [Dehalococcoidales bacterium]|nr:FAD:protein FMN transferase [Dehalococcoidales bacterium]